MKRTAYFVLASITDDNGNFVPCIAEEGVRGYNRTDWQWGKDLDIAERIAGEKNAALGLAADDVARIVASSMVAV